MEMDIGRLIVRSSSRMSVQRRIWWPRQAKWEPENTSIFYEIQWIARSQGQRNLLVIRPRKNVKGNGTFLIIWMKKRGDCIQHRWVLLRGYQFDLQTVSQKLLKIFIFPTITAFPCRAYLQLIASDASPKSVLCHGLY